MHDAHGSGSTESWLGTEEVAFRVGAQARCDPPNLDTFNSTSSCSTYLLGVYMAMSEDADGTIIAFANVSTVQCRGAKVK